MVSTLSNEGVGSRATIVTKDEGVRGEVETQDGIPVYVMAGFGV